MSLAGKDAAGERDLAEGAPAAADRDEGVDRADTAKGGIAAAEDQLLGLDEELDLADAAAAELDVVALDRDLVVALVGGHLALHRVHVGDRAVIEILAPDERRDLVEERLTDRIVEEPTRGVGDVTPGGVALPPADLVAVQVERYAVGDARLGGAHELVGLALPRRVEDEAEERLTVVPGQVRPVGRPHHAVPEPVGRHRELHRHRRRGRDAGCRVAKEPIIRVLAV